MKVKSVTPIAVDLPLSKPIKLSDIEIGTSENVLVRVEGPDGAVGWGEAPAAPTMTGETVESLVAAVNFLSPAVLGRDADDLAGAIEALEARMYGNASAKSAIEIALFDMVGKAQGKPVAKLLGEIRRDRMPVLRMLGNGDTQADIDDARQLVQYGFRTFKIKVGVNPVEVDAERACRIREALGGTIVLSADANQAWTRPEAVAFVTGAEEARLDFIEQPVRGADVDGMAEVAAATQTPIGADEGLHGIDDIRRHHAASAARGGSLKLIKFGGLRRTLEAASLTESLDMKVNLAGKIAESSIASAAVLHLACAAPQVDWGLSLSNQYLAADVVRNPIEIVDGHTSLPAGAGLGIEVDEDAVGRFARAA